MLLPQYSIRQTMFGVTAAAGFFLVLGLAYRGTPWAIVIAAGVACAAGALLFYAWCYLLIAAIARIVGADRLAARTEQGGWQNEPALQSPAAEPVAHAASPPTPQ